MAEGNGGVWDLSPFFPGPDSPELTAAIASLRSAVEEFLGELRGKRSGTGAAEMGALLARLNQVMEQAELVDAYLTCVISVDNANQAARSQRSRLELIEVDFTRCQLALEEIATSSKLDPAAAETADHAHFLSQTMLRAQRRMNPEEEDLLASLDPVARSAWKKLHQDVTSLLEVTVDLPDGRRTLPVQAVRDLATDPSPEVRSAALEAELLAWKDNQGVLAAALNGVKGQEAEISRRRGWKRPVDESLLDNAVSAATLEAMHAAVVEALPDFRRYLRLKASLLDLPVLAWSDLAAPVGSASSEVWSFDRACDFVIETFHAFDSSMGDLAERARRESWMDGPPRAGKRGGAFCIPIGGQSRILLNHTGSFDNVSTMAHELGHAYHNLCLEGRTPLQAQLTMALAETASTFSEALVTEAAIDQAGPADRVRMLEAGMQHATGIVLDIHSRYLFETRVLARRAGGELAPEEFCELMTQAQAETYGDGLDPERMHPYMWAVKTHYYGWMFYNWPYSFGYLFSLALRSIHAQRGAAFVPAYRELLSRVGMATAEELAASVDLDVTDVGFWRAGLDQVRTTLGQMEEAAAVRA